MSEVMEVIHRHGGLVIFDEMLSGFRVAFGGMQQLWGVRPDLSCFGKSIANGLPLAVLCGKHEYMRRLSETEGLLDERIRQRMEEVKGPAQWRRTDRDGE
jgi:glutamate-1-semialdehyde aminotransferase